MDCLVRIVIAAGIVVLLIVGAASSAALGAAVAIRASPPHDPVFMTQWDAVDGAVVPGDFRVLSFPRRHDVQTFDQPGGTPQRRLDRALLNELSELEDEWVAVRNGTTQWVQRNQITESLGHGETETAVARLKETMRSRTAATGVPQQAEISIATEGQSHHIVISYGEADSIRRWTYVETNGVVVPVRAEYANRMTKLGVGDRVMLIGATLGVFAFAVLIVCGRRIARMTSMSRA